LAEIVYMPWKKIIVHEVNEMEVGDFLQMMIGQVEAQKVPGDPVVDWAEGVMFVRGNFPETAEVIQEKLKGIIHYGIISFARTSYQPEKRTQFGGRDRLVRLRKIDKNGDLLNLCKFLSEFKGPDSSVSATLTTS
jgi:hypothetical protein